MSKEERRAAREANKADKKPFKETKVGIFLKEKAPKVLDIVGDLLPDNGIFGIAKNLISSSPDMTTDDKAKALELLDHDLKEYELEIQDRDSARSREVEIAKTGKRDWMMLVTGVIGLGSFVFIIVAVVYKPELQDNKLLIHLLGMVEVVATSIFFYYFGSSKGSKDKTKLLGKK